MANTNQIIKVGLMIFILSGVALGDLCNPADTEDCATCCKGDAPNAECITDILKCPLNPNPDFSVLVTILYILGGFIIGIPLVLFIIDKIFCSNLFNCKMSVCECIANYICCCCCLSREKPPIEFEDVISFNLQIMSTNKYYPLSNPLAIFVERLFILKKIEEQENLDDKKKKPSNKVAPEQK